MLEALGWQLGTLCQLKWAEGKVDLTCARYLDTELGDDADSHKRRKKKERDRSRLQHRNRDGVEALEIPRGGIEAPLRCLQDGVGTLAATDAALLLLPRQVPP